MRVEGGGALYPGVDCPPYWLCMRVEGGGTLPREKFAPPPPIGYVHRDDI